MNEQLAVTSRRGGIAKKLLYAVITVLVVLVLVLGYLGFVPGVSKIFGSDKPRDLGVVPDSGDSGSIQAKTGIRYMSLPTGSIATYSLTGSKAIDATFTDKELTALMALQEKMWKYYPISDAQVRFNSDGTAELSGILRTDRIYGYAAATGISMNDVKFWLDKVSVFAPNPPIYIKGSVDVANGEISGGLQKLEIGRLPVPVSVFTDNQKVILDFAQNRLDEAGIKSESAHIGAGDQVSFKGDIPATVGFMEQ